jgi:pyruvate,water dikinase
MEILRHLRQFRDLVFKPKEDLVNFQVVFEHFQELLNDNQRAMELIADLGEKSGGEYIFDRKYLIDVTHELQNLLLRLVKTLNLISDNHYPELYSTIDRIFLPLEA